MLNMISEDEFGVGKKHNKKEVAIRHNIKIPSQREDHVEGSLFNEARVAQSLIATPNLMMNSIYRWLLI